MPPQEMQIRMKLNKAKGTASPELVQKFSLLGSRVFEGKSPFAVLEADNCSIDDSPNVDEFSMAETHVKRQSIANGSTMAVYNSL